MNKKITSKESKEQMEELSAKLKAVGNNNKKPISKKVVNQVVNDIMIGRTGLDESYQYYFVLKYILFNNSTEASELVRKTTEIETTILALISDFVDKVHGCVQNAKIKDEETVRKELAENE